MELAPADDPKRPEWASALAEAYNRAGRYKEAAQQLAALLQRVAAPQDRPPLLCRLADIQVCLDVGLLPGRAGGRVRAGGWLGAWDAALRPA